MNIPWLRNINPGWDLDVFFPDVQMSKIHQSSSQEQYKWNRLRGLHNSSYMLQFYLALFELLKSVTTKNTCIWIWALEVYDPSINGNTMKVETCFLTIFKKDNMPILEASFRHLLSTGCFSLGISENGESWIQNLPFLKGKSALYLSDVFIWDGISLLIDTMRVTQFFLEISWISTCVSLFHPVFC